MQQYNLKVTKTARYFQLGVTEPNLERVWFVCHGYGHMASYFIKHFDVLDNGQNLIIAPEGLSRFYLQGFSGRIGATWMTSEDRLNEIADYVNYLDAVYEKVFNQIDRSSVKVDVLGFSQGAATVSRWINQGRAKVDHLILWAGLMPPELDSIESLKKFQRLHLTLVFGKNDAFADGRLISEQEARLKENGVPYILIPFEGGHELNAKVLKKLSDNTT